MFNIYLFAGSSGTMCYKISEFLEKDLLPPFFTEEHLSHLIPFQAELMDFFKRVSLSLWQLDQKNFPKNAYDFSSTIARIVANLTSSVDSRQKVIVFCLFNLWLINSNLEAGCSLPWWFGYWQYGLGFSVCWAWSHSCQVETFESLEGGIQLCLVVRSLSRKSTFTVLSIQWLKTPWL